MFLRFSHVQALRLRIQGWVGMQGLGLVLCGTLIFGVCSRDCGLGVVLGVGLGLGVLGFGAAES